MSFACTPQSDNQDFNNKIMSHTMHHFGILTYGTDVALMRIGVYTEANCLYYSS